MLRWQKILKFQSPKMRFPAFGGLNWIQKGVFVPQEKVAFIQDPIYQPHNQLLQAMNKWQ